MVTQLTLLFNLVIQVVLFKFVSQSFLVADKSSGYTLKLGAYSHDKSGGFADPGDSFSSHSGAKFTTPDVANAGFKSHGGFHGCGKNFNVRLK